MNRRIITLKSTKSNGMCYLEKQHEYLQQIYKEKLIGKENMENFPPIYTVYISREANILELYS